MFLKKLFKKKAKNAIHNVSAHPYAVKSDSVGQVSSLDVTVVKTDERPFYDSWWVVITRHCVVRITRYDNETAENLIEDIKKLPALTEENIKTLDKRDRIYYD